MSSASTSTSAQVVPAPIYTDLRNQILTLSPYKAGILPLPETPNVWGVLMETGYPEAVVTLVSLADGTTSLYFGGGGGMIGGGAHIAVAEATKKFVSDTEQHLKRMTLATACPLPTVGRVCFYVLTLSGTFTAEADENDLRKGRHGLSLLFYSGHRVITQLRRHVGQQR